MGLGQPRDRRPAGHAGDPDEIGAGSADQEHDAATFDKHLQRPAVLVRRTSRTGEEQRRAAGFGGDRGHRLEGSLNPVAQPLQRLKGGLAARSRGAEARRSLDTRTAGWIEKGHRPAEQDSQRASRDHHVGVAHSAGRHPSSFKRASHDRRSSSVAALAPVPDLFETPRHLAQHPAASMVARQQTEILARGSSLIDPPYTLLFEATDDGAIGAARGFTRIR